MSFHDLVHIGQRNPSAPMGALTLQRVDVGQWEALRFFSPAWHFFRSFSPGLHTGGGAFSGSGLGLEPELAELKGSRQASPAGGET